MPTRRVIFVFLFFFALAASAPAFAQPAHLYQYYFSEGKKAFERNDDEAAFRYFRWARQIDSSSQEADLYLEILAERMFASKDQEPQNPEPAQDLLKSTRYEDLLKKGKDSLDTGDSQKAIQYFYTAHLLVPKAQEPLDYINLIKRIEEQRAVPVSEPKAVSEALTRHEISPPVVSAVQLLPEKKPSPEAKPSMKAPEVPQKPQPVIVSPKKAKPLDVVSLSEILKSSKPRPTLRVQFGIPIIVEGKNITRFLLVEEGIIEVKRISRDRIEIDPRKRASVFLHIWDDTGRSTIYVEVVLPQVEGEAAAQRNQAIEHSRRFRLSYSNDWSSYYYGNNIPQMHRRSLNFEQSVGIDGETPYGIFDSSATLVGFNPIKDIPTYTIGLSDIPVAGTQNLNVRIFDASRWLSPLTLPGTYLRGEFVDTKVLGNAVGLSVSQGKLQPVFGILAQGNSSARKSYVNAFKMTLFPEDMDHHYSLNYAEGYGSQRDVTLAKQAYSIEGVHKIDKVTLNAELAHDEKTLSSLGGAKWSNGALSTSLSFRDIDKSFMTVTSAPSNQGELGMIWNTNANLEKFSVATGVDAYRNRLDFNPNNPDGFNYDATAEVHVPINKDLSSDSNVHYIDTQQELSPRRNLALDTRLSQYFNIWGGRKGMVYVGGAYQKSRYAFAPASEYDRYSATAGVNVPLTSDVSYFGNYEYSWVNDLLSGDHLTPSVFNTGLNYNKEFLEHLNGSLGVSYRKESHAEGLNSFLSGEDSLAGSAGLNYNPTDDTSYFLDGRLRNVWSLIPGNPSYNDADVRFGMKTAWGTPACWDPTGVVAGIVFKDKNGNGRYDPGEPGVKGVKVKVGDKEVPTDSEGRYRAEVNAKRVLITPVMETVPQGFIFSTPTFAMVKIAHWRTEGVDFGLTTNSGIYGVVFVDKNGNGKPDQGDQFIGKAQFILDDKVKQMSDAQGAYFFNNISEGKHKIAIDIKTLPTGLIPLIKLVNEVTVSEGTTYILHVPMRIKPEDTPAP
ncbi:MAG: hypothetical protein HQL16_04020 [Candidatus Omnitrophica bacterium]|nr:hypothetical protein [Candidatus Omnitrophota bacterium]